MTNLKIKTFFFFLLTLSPLSLAYAKPAEVHAIASTDIPSVKSDVMDDPVIWINQKDPPKSLILATHKRAPYGGLYMYTLQGKLKDKLLVGPLNNIDYRARFPYKGKDIDIAVASHTEKKKLAFFGIDPQYGHASFLGFSPHSFQKIPYGFCLSKRNNLFYAIVTFVDGGTEKWQFWEEKGKLQTKKIMSYPIPTQAEGCVANDLDGSLFLAEEDKGIWVFPETAPPYLIAKVGENDLAADIEGLTLYKGQYLIASSQGNSTYAVFLSHPPYTYLGNFSITQSKTQEGTEKTDGIDATAINLGGPYSQGLFVAHDNRSSKGGSSNFKLVPWAEIARQLRLE